MDSRVEIETLQPSSSGSTMVSTPSTLNPTDTIVLTVDGRTTTVDVANTVIQPAETSTATAVSISRVTQISLGEVTSAPPTSSATPSHLDTPSQVSDGTSGNVVPVAISSSQITTIIRMTANPPLLPMISAFLGGALTATLVITVCLVLIRRRRTRLRKRRPWTLNATPFKFNEGDDTPGKATSF